MTTPPPLPDLDSAAHFDAVSFTARGVPYDAVIDALLARMPRGTAYALPGGSGRGVAVPKLAHLRPDAENPVLVRHVASTGDIYASVMGPLASSVLEAARDLAAAYPPPPVHGQSGPWAFCTRINRLDACVDIDAPGAFDSAQAHARASVLNLTGNRPKIDQRGDWQDPDSGRTLYVGSRDSVLLRIYEKGKQLRQVKGIADASLDLVRVEVECHPADAARFEALHWVPAQVLATSRHAIEVLSFIGYLVPSYVASRDSGTRSPVVRSLLAMQQQYGPLFWRLAQRFDSPEAAAAMIVHTLLQAHPSPARLQAVLDGGISAPELQAVAERFTLSKEHDAELRD